MMTNASPAASLQLIGFPSHQNLRFIDHDKAARLGRRRINGQKETQRLRASSPVPPLTSHSGRSPLVRRDAIPTGEGQLFPPPEAFPKLESLAVEQT